MIRRLYDWTMRLADTRYALWALALVAFAESSFFPIPPDVLLIPMIIARPSRAFMYAALATVSSVVGGLAGYWIGFGLNEAVAQPIIDFYGATDDVAHMRDWFNEYGAWAVVVAGVTPFPFKIITIVSGMTSLNLVVFLLSALFARALRFFIVAALLWKFGEPIRDFIDRRLALVFTLFCVLLIGGFAAIAYL
ncbi:YqaA family protein [Pelagovum pacificum]|uniref:DedA family protein n=1 Tax=Pelagovum pacificum TaxID=2588711 RepID=A0A5C5GBA2_9RHOB|nr:YqaA family protein [Pelagovum pacificum]QQA44799.1 DedA family protein [Pelagovum pacificum]TNY32095.1 DedA family protein [Pelagovum pacificum]